jgi:hypothetical protein
MQEAAAGGRQFDAVTWDGEPLVRFECTLGELPTRLPIVIRRPFTLASVPVSDMSDESFAGEIFAVLRAEDLGLAAADPSAPPGQNPYRDCIVRLPGAGFDREIPLGIASKRYQIVQHHQVIGKVTGGLDAAGIAWPELPVTVRQTELGSRVHFTVHLPDQYQVKVGDTPLGLTIECLNSVDRSWALRVGMGWVVAVCDNGLFFGKMTASLRRLHVASTSLEDVPTIVHEGFEQAVADAERWRFLSGIRVTPSDAAKWVDGPIANKWGSLAAIRALHIIETGRDGVPVDRHERVPPSRRRVSTGAPVPGSCPPNDDVFRIGQVLSWLANRRTEWGATIERRRQIPDLLTALMNADQRQHWNAIGRGTDARDRLGVPPRLQPRGEQNTAQTSSGEPDSASPQQTLRDFATRAAEAAVEGLRHVARYGKGRQSRSLRRASRPQTAPQELIVCLTGIHVGATF